jgi:hypothetical protein
LFRGQIQRHGRAAGKREAATWLHFMTWSLPSPLDC